MSTAPVRETRIILAGGGTGGHIFPGIAVARELRGIDPGAVVIFAGSPGGLEQQLVPDNGWELKLLPSVKSSGLSGLLRLPFRLLSATIQGCRMLKEFRGQCVVALGGYASCAPALAAWIKGIPVIVLEQNAIPGRVSRLLGLIAKRVHATYEESLKHFPRPGRVRITGNPVRPEVLRAARQPGSLPAEFTAARPLRLLITGGSQGARRMNELVLGALRMLTDLEGRIAVTHITGEANLSQCTELAADLPLKADLVGFERDMAARYAATDLIISRAGATALAEISACAIPAILVPFPYAKDNHQEANARSFERSGAAVVFREGELSPSGLAARIRTMVEDPESLNVMSRKMAMLSQPEAGIRIARDILETIGKHRRED